MQISAVRMNYPTYNHYNNTRTNNSHSPAFQGILNEAQTNYVLQKLNQKNSEVIENFSKTVLDKVISELTAKYRNKTSNSVGIMVVPNRDLPKLLGENSAKYDTNGKIGLCVAVGDTYGPIEIMRNIYEAKTILTTKEAIKI